jgi:hypothetical protein
MMFELATIQLMEYTVVFSPTHLWRFQPGPRRTEDLQREEELVWQGKSSEFMVFGFEQLLDAANNFSEENKLGQGGFGVVYKVNK